MCRGASVITGNWCALVAGDQGVPSPRPLVELVLRAAQPGVRTEAITSNALLLAAGGRVTKHTGKTTLHMAPLHAAKATLMRLIACIRTALSYFRLAG